MAASPIRLIAGREIRDTLTDWRILVPTFILTFALPMVLIAAARYAIDFIGDARTVSQLIPFILLLVGFIPASFSIITALESFVGERERNSLEALLAMPIGDNQLYLGKLLSSLLPPLLSAYLAMIVCALTLWLSAPDLFFGGLTVRYAIIVILLISTKAVVMVSGAVIISSHTTSIRAANLLASFVLLPTASLIQIEAILMLGPRGWDTLQVVVLALGVVAIVLVRTGMGAFSREEILSREHEQLNIRRVGRTFGLFFREFQPAGTPPDGYANLPFSPRRFYRHELPALLREYRLPLLVALIAAVAGAFGGGYIGSTYNVRIFDGMMRNVGSADSLAIAGVPLTTIVLVNNIRVSVLSNLFSLFSFGAFAFLVPFVAFGQVGFVASTLAARGGSWLVLGSDSPLQFLLGYVLPHGIIELPTAILGAAMGIRIGAALMAPPKGFTVGQNILWAFAQYAKVWLLVLLPLFALGAVIEGFVMPQVVRSLYGL